MLHMRSASALFVGGVDTTHIDVLAQQLVRHSVLVNDVVVETRAGGEGAEKESEDPIIRLSVP